MSGVGRTVGDMSTDVTLAAGTPDVPEVPDAPEPRLPSLSPSRASDFLTCPLLYRFRVIDRLPEPPSPAATRGTVVHAVLERLFDLPAAERIPAQRSRAGRPRVGAAARGRARAGRAVRRRRRRATSGSASAAGLLDAYFALEDPTGSSRPSASCSSSATSSPGCGCAATSTGSTWRPDGALRVVDYKTGRAPREGFEAKAMFQMRFYALVLWRLRGQVPRLLQLLYLGSGEVLRYEPDEADLRATERKVVAIWAAIQRATENRRLAAEPEQALRLVRPPGVVSRLRRHSPRAPGAAGARRAAGQRSRRAALPAHPGRRGLTPPGHLPDTSQPGSP